MMGGGSLQHWLVLLRLDFRRSLVSGLPSPRRTVSSGRSAGSFLEQRLVIEPKSYFEGGSHEL